MPSIGVATHRGAGELQQRCYTGGSRSNLSCAHACSEASCACLPAAGSSRSTATQWGWRTSSVSCIFESEPVYMRAGVPPAAPLTLPPYFPCCPPPAGQLLFQELAAPGNAWPLAVMAKGEAAGGFTAGSPLTAWGPPLSGFDRLVGRGLFTYGRYNCSGSLRCAENSGRLARGCRPCCGSLGAALLRSRLFESAPHRRMQAHRPRVRSAWHP